MYEVDYDIVVIGGGPAGLAAAIEGKKRGVERVLIIERDSQLGGILQQCIHPGFGLHLFNRELTGPEYAYIFINQVKTFGIDTLLDTMVLEIDKEKRIVYGVNKNKGICKISFKALILAMGCRERTRGAIAIPGTRPAGIFTAGTAQRFINIQGYMVGKRVVILGSGDIGMIMARRLTLEGAKVEGVVEIMPYLAGLTRNRVQCLDDFNIPLYLSHTVIDIKGKKRVEKVTVAQVDDDLRPIYDTAWEIECDTLLLSIGLIPENELSRACGIDISPLTQGPVVNQKMETSVEGIFACGNVVHVNDLVDNVTLESKVAGKFAGDFALGKKSQVLRTVAVRAGRGVRYVVPHRIEISRDIVEDVTLYFRVQEPATNVTLQVVSGGNLLAKARKIKVNPGEMEKLKISKEVIRDMQEDVIVQVMEEV